MKGVEQFQHQSEYLICLQFPKQLNCYLGLIVDLLHGQSKIEKQSDIILCHFRSDSQRQMKVVLDYFHTVDFFALPNQQYEFHFKGNTEINIQVYILKCTNLSLCSLNLSPGNQNFSACFVSVQIAPHFDCTSFPFCSKQTEIMAEFS